MTPYQALYGAPPPSGLLSPTEDNSREIQAWAKERESLTKELRMRLQESQNRMKQQADKHRKEKEYRVGDWVYLKLQPYRQITVAVRRNLKLTSRYFGPFEILERVGTVAYRLRLPDETRIHPVFHVSMLKRSPTPAATTTPTIPLIGKEGQLLAEPEQILDHRVTGSGKTTNTEALIKWSNLPAERATWEDLAFIKSQFPDFNP